MVVKIEDSNFTSYLDTIEVNKNLSEHKNVDYGRKLICSILNLTQFSDDSNNLITPTYFRRKNSSELNHIVSSTPSHEKASSQAEMLFSQDVPIVSVVTDFLASSEDKMHFSNSEIRGSWLDVVNSLLNEVVLYDINKNKINPHSIKNIESVYINNVENHQNPHLNQSLNKTLDAYLGQYFELDYQNKKAKVKDRNFLRIVSSTAQRSITPFVFNNCKQACRFCYVDRGLSAIKYPHNWCRKLDDIDKVLEDFDEKSGKSHPILRFAMMDWEPTEHPQFFEILNHLGKKAPQQQIPIVTHGGALTEELLSKIADNEVLKKNVLFQVSLNSANVFYRSRLMPGAKPSEHKNAIKSIELMDRMGINFDVSLVAATNILPMEDIINTIKYVDNFKPHSYIRVALPTATKHHNPQLLRSKEELREIDNIITGLRPEIKAPIITTVALENRNNLRAIVEEVIPGSAADLCGIESGDEILEIGNKKIRSRTEANILLSKAWYQKENRLPMKLRKADLTMYSTDLAQSSGKNDPRMAGERAVGLWGLLIHDDVDYGIFEKIASLQKKHNLKYPNIFTGCVIEPFFQEAINKLEGEEKIDNLSLNKTENKYFGGNVSIAGLLTFGDLYDKVKEVMAKGQKVDSIFISQSMLSRGGYDLQGFHINEFRAQTGLPIFALKSRTGSI